MSARQTWVRRNRWGLLLFLPVTLLAVAASSSRLQLFWWPSEPRHVVTERSGIPIHYTEPWRDADGDHTREVRLTVGEPRAATTMEDLDGRPVAATAPAGTTLWDIPLEWDVTPAQVLFGCRLEVRDAAGRVYPTSALPVEADGVPVSSGCTPFAHPGPSQNDRFDVPRTAEELARPQRYTTHVYTVTTSGSPPTLLRISWEPLRALDVELSAAR